MKICVTSDLHGILPKIEEPCESVIMVGGNHDFALANMYRQPLKINSILSNPTNGKLELLDNEATSVVSKDGKVYGELPIVKSSVTGRTCMNHILDIHSVDIFIVVSMNCKPLTI